MVGKSRKERTGIKPQNRAQLSAVKACLRTTDHFYDSLLEVAVLGEKHTLPFPQSIGIKLSDIGQSVEAAIVIVTGMRPPCF